MKKLLVFSLFLCSLLMACKSTKTAGTTSAADPAKLNGTWELNYITTSRTPFKDLYPDKKPTLIFNVTQEKVNGNTGCNTFLGIFKVNGSVIDFTSPMALTKMACPGTGEQVFLDALKAINSYSINGKTLSFMSGGTETMRFEKK